MQQVHIGAAPEAIWNLVGDPNRHPEWWPEMLEVECADLHEGCRYRGVVKGPFRAEEHELTIERLDGCREVSIFCEGTGVTTRFVLADAQGGTFVELEMGIEARRVADRIFDKAAGRAYFRRWARQSLDGLRDATLEAHRG